MWVYRNIRPIEGERWGFDNGVFKDWDRKGPMRSSSFDGDAYLRRVERAYRAGVPHFAVVPDLIGAGRESLEHSIEWLPRLPKEWPLYLAVQDGMSADDVEVALMSLPFAGVFLGGSSAFKSTARLWSSMAHRLGLRFHFARCSSQQAWARACAVGADSVDSSQMLWRLQMLNAWENTTRQSPLFWET